VSQWLTKVRYRAARAAKNYRKGFLMLPVLVETCWLDWNFASASWVTWPFMIKFWSYHPSPLSSSSQFENVQTHLQLMLCVFKVDLQVLQRKSSNFYRFCHNRYHCCIIVIYRHPGCDQTVSRSCRWSLCHDDYEEGTWHLDSSPSFSSSSTSPYWADWILSELVWSSSWNIMLSRFWLKPPHCQHQAVHT